MTTNTIEPQNPTIIMKPVINLIVKNEIDIDDTTPPTNSGGVHVYHQRKNMLSEYKELFSALFKLPDKDLHQKVLRCINAKYRSIQTQTDPVEITNISQDKDGKIDNDVEVCNIKTEFVSSPNDTCSEPSSSKPETPKKRKRKRKVSLPQANKVSRVALAQKKQMAKLNNPQQPKQQTGVENGGNGVAPKRSRLDSTLSYLNYMVDDFDKETDLRCREKFMQNIIKECILADVVLENGLLPIHESIVKNQLSNLNIQIFIWKQWKGVDLNDLLTDDDEDLLQLAVMHNCSPDIVNLLLVKGLNPNGLDGHGNTVIHLAILNDIDQSALEMLMQKIDLKMLLALNDDGYTSLQLAIRQDCYLLAECLLNTMDKQLSGDIFYKRDDDVLETDEKIRRKHFHSYYENVCLEMEVGDEGNGVGAIINNHDLKQKLLQALDMRSGNTALFFALENQSEHLIYFLLAHLTDPRTENLSGQDCRTFFSEFGKTLNLSLNIDGVMEKAIKLLS